ncbi:MAG: NAD(+) synthase [Candidatus Aenigmarchaeota archaeon]|nr:NAD(+) synthase [Candidatus Aenigmarchaeota archaeon]
MPPQTSIRDRIVAFIRAAAPGGVVVGMSGGVDSSVVASLCAEALGRTKVLGLILPASSTPAQDTTDAQQVAGKLGIPCRIIPIEGVLRALEQALGPAASADSDCLPDQKGATQRAADPSPPRGELARSTLIAQANLAPRLRMAVLYYHANLLGRLVAGTGNRSELLTGYFTKHGDGGVDFLPLGGLYKREILALAKELSIPAQVISKPPSAGLWPGQTDEGDLGLPYAALDSILAALLDQGLPPAAAAAQTGMDPATVAKVLSLLEASRHKRALPPVGPRPGEE